MDSCVRELWSIASFIVGHLLRRPQLSNKQLSEVFIGCRMRAFALFLFVSTFAVPLIRYSCFVRCLADILLFIKTYIQAGGL